MSVSVSCFKLYKTAEEFNLDTMKPDTSNINYLYSMLSEFRGFFPFLNGDAQFSFRNLFFYLDKVSLEKAWLKKKWCMSVFTLIKRKSQTWSDSLLRNRLPARQMCPYGVCAGFRTGFPSFLQLESMLSLQRHSETLTGDAMKGIHMGRIQSSFIFLN